MVINKDKNKLAMHTKMSIISIAAMFMLFGFNIGSWVSRLATLKINLGLNDSELSMLLLATGLGAVTAFPLVMLLLKVFKAKKTLLMSSLLAAITLLCLAINSDYYLSLLIMYCEGVLCATINTSINLLGNQLERRLQRKIMSRLHATFSFGIFFGASLSLGVLLVTDKLWLHFLVAAIFISVITLCFYSFLPNEKTEKSKKDHKPQSNAGVKFTLCLGAVLFLSTIVEGAMIDWSSIYLIDVIKADNRYASLGLAVFSMAMFLARLYADNWRKKYNDFHIIAFGSGVCTLSLILGVSFGGLLETLVMFSVVGVAIAAVSPCIYSIAALSGCTNLSLMATFGSVGTLLGPPLIGFISDSAGLMVGLYFVGGCSFIATVMASILRINQKNLALSLKPLNQSI